MILVEKTQRKKREKSNKEVRRKWYKGLLPLYIESGGSEFKLKNSKPSFWRTFTQSDINGEHFYYQQIVKKKAIFQTTFKELMRPFGTWKGILDSVEWLTCN